MQADGNTAAQGWQPDVDPFQTNSYLSSHPLIWKLDDALQGRDIVDVRCSSCNTCVH
jgi:hypothetical protein